MKRILVVCANGDSPLTGFAIRVRLIVKSLAENGYHVQVLRLYPAFRHRTSWRSVLANSSVKLLEIPMLPASRFQFLKPLTTFLSNILIHLVARFHRMDLIQAEAHEAAYPALKHNLTALPIVVDFHGAAPEEVVARNRHLPSRGNAHHWLEKAERTCVDKSKAVFVVSPKMVEHLERKHMTDIGAKSYLVPVNVSDDFVGEANRLEMRKRLGFGAGDVVYVYSGGTQEYQCIEQTLHLFSRIEKQDPNARLLILSGDREGLKVLIDRYFPDAKSSIAVHSLKSTEVYRHLVCADMALLLRKDEILNIVSCPTKFGEYLMAGLPVITTAYAGHAPDVVEAHDVGIIIDMEKDESGRIISYSRSISSETKQRCVHVAQQELNWKKSIGRILDCYNDLLSSKPVQIKTMQPKN